jgi:hypothetical protein
VIKTINKPIKNIIAQYQEERWEEEEEEGMETTFLKKNLIQESEGNEENGYPVLDSKKTIITLWNPL